MSDPLLDAAAIRALLVEVADELDAVGGNEVERSEVVVVGGALLALHGMRDATRDVDTVRPVRANLAEAVTRVADRRGLAPSWMNDRARAFLPETFQITDCDVLLDRPSLLVLGAPFDQVFLMKVHAGRAADTDDLEALWPHCSFGTPATAAAAYEEAYPHESPDPNLADWIAGIV